MEPRYKRYVSDYQQNKVNSPERRAFEQQIVSDFLTLHNDVPALKVKVERRLFDELLDGIGFSLQQFAENVVANPSNYPQLNEVLENYPVPIIAAEILPPKFRIFCLALNALKQWVSAEQQATDRVLLGGDYAEKLKTYVQSCLVTNEPLAYDVEGAVERHHVMRDGRFPIPLSKNGHDRLENQVPKIKLLKRKKSS